MSAMSDEDNDLLESFVLSLYNIGAIKFGEFKLKSGLVSPVYIDMRLIFGYPELVKTLAELIWTKTKSYNYDVIVGVPYTALPIATAVSIAHSKPLVIVRKEPKNYGTAKIVDGVYSSGSSCIIIEDVVTSGSSIIETRTKLESAELVVTGAIVSIDRGQGALENLSKSGIDVKCVTNLKFIVSTLTRCGKLDENVKTSVLNYLNSNSTEICSKDLSSTSPASKLNYRNETWSHRASMTKSSINKILFNIIESKQSNLCFSADVTTKVKILNLAELVGPEICILKIHADIIEDFDVDFVKKLVALAEKHKFLLFEDRKFADIGNTVELQYTGGVFHISDWADIVTSHINAGASAIESLIGCIKNQNQQTKPRSIVLLSQMSTTDSTMNGSFVSNSVRIAQKYPEFISGFICQQKICEDDGFVYFTPGVSLMSGEDCKGQKYTTSEDVVIDRRTDVVIVGRGIYSSPDPLFAARAYRKRSWDAYVQRTIK